MLGGACADAPASPALRPSRRRWPSLRCRIVTAGATARIAQTVMDARLAQELATILKLEAGPKQQCGLVACIKAFPEQPARKRALAEAQRMDAERKKQAKP